MASSMTEISTGERTRLSKQSSMVNWWPKVRCLGIPVPKTSILPITPEAVVFWSYLEGSHPARLEDNLESRAKRLGYPLFVRTDQTSAKHDWKDSCFVESEGELLPHVRAVVTASEELMGVISPQAVVLREYIPMDTKFTAFRGDMPVAAERRYFIRGGQVECHHPYWFEDPIAETERYARNLPTNWRGLLAGLNKEDQKEVDLLTSYAIKLAQVLEGYWSVDFARAKCGNWYFIDAARGELSFHLEPNS